MAELKVSVCVVTYNQKDYIRRCLQSIVDQQVDFKFEVVIGDDCSTDGTQHVVREFSEKYPDLIVLLNHQHNVGAYQNYRMVHKAARGVYVAHIDGDDYMLQGKLAKQASYLDANMDCILVAHRMLICTGEQKTGITMECESRFNIERLLSAHPMFLNSSIMYRSKAYADLFPAMGEFIDFRVYVGAALISDIGFINEVLGGYENNVGISSKKNLMPLIHNAIDHAKGAVSNDVLSAALAKQYFSYGLRFLREKEYDRFIEYVRLARQHNVRSYAISSFYFLRGFPSFLRFSILCFKKVQQCAAMARARRI